VNAGKTKLLLFKMFASKTFASFLCVMIFWVCFC